MKATNRFLVRIESEYQEKVGSIYNPGVASFRTVCGTVIDVPKQYQGPRWPVSEPVPDGNLSPFITATDKGRYFYPATIQDVVPVGAKIYFHEAANSPENLISEGVLAVHPTMVYAYQPAEGELTPYAGKAIIEHIPEPTITPSGIHLVLAEKTGKDIVWGKVLAVSKPLRGQTERITVGETVGFLYGYMGDWYFDGIGKKTIIPFTKILLGNGS
jgi:co-chaperonin GroES (HSP10)